MKGTASLIAARRLRRAPALPAALQLQFGALDAAVLQTAFLGAHERGTLLSTLLDRLRPTAAPAWPQLEGTVKAESLILGPVTLHEPVGHRLHACQRSRDHRLRRRPARRPRPRNRHVPRCRLRQGQAFLRTLKASLKSSARRPSASCSACAAPAAPSTATARSSSPASPAATWPPRPKARSTSSGSTEPSPQPRLGSVPPALARFDRWTADAEIANGALTLKENQVKRGAHTQPVQADHHSRRSAQGRLPRAQTGPAAPKPTRQSASPPTR